MTVRQDGVELEIVAAAGLHDELLEFELAEF